MSKTTVLLLLLLPSALEAYSQNYEFEEPIILGKELKIDQQIVGSMADFDGDGVNDLVVSGDKGVFRWAKNIGTNKKPKYNPLEKLFKRYHC